MTKTTHTAAGEVHEYTLYTFTHNNQHTTGWWTGTLSPKRELNVEINETHHESTTIHPQNITHILPIPRPNYFNTFNEYAHAFPNGETHRRWVTNDGRRDVALLRTTPGQGGLNGHYLWVAVFPAAPRNEPNNPQHIVWVNDCDDGCLQKTFPTKEDAQQEVENLKTLAPLDLADLTALDYNW